jgi:hypothetical protein
VGRHDRETILCTHTMDGHSFQGLRTIFRRDFSDLSQYTQ